MGDPRSVDITVVGKINHEAPFPIHIVDWARLNTPSYITNVAENWIFTDDWVDRTTYTFYFGDPKDALLFRLKWSQTD